MDNQIDTKNAPILVPSPTDQNSVRVFPDEWKAPIKLVDLPQALAKRDIDLEYRIIRVLTEDERMNSRLFRSDDSKDKNRYRDMVPFCDNRVSLPDGSYINASYMVNGDGTNRKAFIASQGPLKSTIADQWKMIHSEKVFSILTIGKLAEGPTEKIAQYWPENVGEVLEIGGVVRIECSGSSELAPGFFKRILWHSVNGGSKKEINHFHYAAWPDHGSITSETMILLASVVKSERSAHPSSPMLIHCSAGVGRTGTVLAIANCVEIVDKQLKETGGDLSQCWLSVMTTVLNLRECRVHIVERTWQYQSIYDAIVELVKQHTKGALELLPLRRW